VVAAFVELVKPKAGESTLWRTRGWAALPSVILDRIMSHVFDDRLAVEDCVPRLPTPVGQFE
jgi:hypothetical protein